MVTSRCMGRMLLWCSRSYLLGSAARSFSTEQWRWELKVLPKGTWCNSPTVSKLALEKPVLCELQYLWRAQCRIFNVKLLRERKQCAGPALWWRGGWQPLLSTFCRKQRCCALLAVEVMALPSLPQRDSVLTCVTALPACPKFDLCFVS